MTTAGTTAGTAAWTTTSTTWWTTVLAAVLLAAGPAGGFGGASSVSRASALGSAGSAGSRGAAPGCAGVAGPGARCWPVTGAGPRGRPVVLRAFDPPASPWAAGHRGVDLRAGPGAAVRAAAPGEVAFTGAVAGVPVVVIALPGGLRTTYEPVRAELPVGTPVAAGRRVGALGGVRLPHCAESCLHWGLLRGDVYLDPLSLLPPGLRRSGPSRLLPLSGPLPGGPAVIPAARDRPAG